MWSLVYSSEGNRKTGMHTWLRGHGASIFCHLLPLHQLPVQIDDLRQAVIGLQDIGCEEETGQHHPRGSQIPQSNPNLPKASSLSSVSLANLNRVGLIFSQRWYRSWNQNHDLTFEHVCCNSVFCFFLSILPGICKLMTFKAHISLSFSFLTEISCSFLQKTFEVLLQIGSQHFIFHEKLQELIYH